MGSLMQDIVMKRLREWDFRHSGSSAQVTHGEPRGVYSVLGPEGSYRGNIHLSFHEAGTIEELFRTAGPVMEMRLCETERVALQPDRTYRFTVDQACENCVRLARKSKGE